MRKLTCLALFVISFTAFAGKDPVYSDIPVFTAVPDAATLVIIRDDGKGPKTSDEVCLYLDKTYQTKSFERSVTSFTVKPGETRLLGLYDNDEDAASVIVKNFEAGKIYYVWVNVYSKFSMSSSLGMTGTVELVFQSKEDATKMITEREDPLKYAKTKETEDTLDDDDYKEILEDYQDYVKENAAKIKAAAEYAGY
jgi:hypothetical protein